MQPLYEADTVITFEVYERFSKAIRRKPNPVLLYGLILVAVALVLDILFFITPHSARLHHGRSSR